MPLRVSRAQAKQYGISAKPKKSSPRERFGGYASSWERDYAAYLAQDGKFQGVVYEGVTLRLAPRTTYTPDFLTIDFRGKLAFHEVKGLPRPAGMVKLKVAAKMFPHFAFYLVRKVNGMWECTRVREN